MYKVYSNLRSCVEGIDNAGNMDAHIALYVLSHHEQIPQMSIRELADACNSSPATISRFCRRVNGSDYRSLKEQIVGYNAWLRSESSKAGAESKIDLPWYFDVLEDALYTTRRLLDEDVIERAVDWLVAASNVYIYGSSFSNIVARAACEQLNRINRLCFSFSSVRAQVKSLELIEPGDVAMLITFSGTNIHTQGLYQRAKLSGCRIIWVSSNRALGGASERELLLPVSSASLSEYRTSLIESVSLQCAINALYISYTNRLRADERA